MKFGTQHPKELRLKPTLSTLFNVLDDGTYALKRPRSGSLDRPKPSLEDEFDLRSKILNDNPKRVAQLLELIRKMIAYPSKRISALEAISDPCFNVIYVKFNLDIPLVLNPRKPHFIKIYTKDEFAKSLEPEEDGVEPMVPAFDFRLALLQRKLFAFDHDSHNLYVIELISRDGVSKVLKELEIISFNSIVISFDDATSETNIEVLEIRE